MTPRLAAGLLLLLALAGCSDSGDGGEEPQGEEREIAIHGSPADYEPTSLRVPAGSTLRFENHDGTRHTAQTADGKYATGDIPAGGSRSVAGLAEGTYSFRCAYHPNMMLTVTVG